MHCLYFFVSLENILWSNDNLVRHVQIKKSRQTFPSAPISLSHCSLLSVKEQKIRKANDWVAKNEILTITLEILYAVCARACVCCVAGGLGASDKQTASTRLWHYTFPLIALAAPPMVVVGRRQRGAFDVKTQSRRPIYATPAIIQKHAQWVILSNACKTKTTHGVRYLLGHNFTLAVFAQRSLLIALFKTASNRNWRIPICRKISTFIEI